MDSNKVVDYHDTTLTPNTRCAYPLSHISNALLPAVVTNHPSNIILLVCDAFGLLPPLARLTSQQAIFFFINGYTSKIPGTEQGVTQPLPTFSACFGEPFLVHSPQVYGDMLAQKIEKHQSQVWLINTGWIKGPFGKGERISITYSRAMIEAIHQGFLESDSIEWDILPYFKIKIPTSCPRVPSNILDPRVLAPSATEYDQKLSQLYQDFCINYQKKRSPT